MNLCDASLKKSGMFRTMFVTTDGSCPYLGNGSSEAQYHYVAAVATGPPLAHCDDPECAAWVLFGRTHIDLMGNGSIKAAHLHAIYSHDSPL